jgi:lipoyl(octanoyl) transferase
VTALTVCDLGFEPMTTVWAKMQAFTDSRDAATPDQVWFVEHPPVYTLGLAADRRHLLAASEIEIVQTDRGGQVTYHGPGQLVCYVLLDLRRRGFDIRRLVQTLEQAVIDTVAAYGIEASGRRDAPGVYVDGRKLAAVGLRVRRGCTYHGLAINVAMDLAPYAGINPCGYEGMEVTQIAALCDVTVVRSFRQDFEPVLLRLLDEEHAVSN